MDLEAQELLQEAQETIEAQHQRLMELSQPAFTLGTVLTHSTRFDDETAKVKNTLIVSVSGRAVEIDEPENWEREIRPGTVARLNSQTLQLLDIVEIDEAGGVATVRETGERMSQVEMDGRVFYCYNGCQELKDGDRIVLDSSGSVAVSNLGQKQRRFLFDGSTKVSWKDIGGLEEAKKQMIEAVELPFTQAELFKRYNKRPIRGILLYGPPGCGKTMLGKATATAFADLHGKDVPGFFYMKGPEVLDRFVGVAEATIRQVFSQAKKHREEHGYPAVIFLDEADALLSKRGSGKSADMEKTIVPTFLTEMDGLEENQTIVIFATNRPDILDPAAVRDGRIDRKVKVDRPTKQGVKEIFKLNLRGVPLSKDQTLTKIVNHATTNLLDRGHKLYEMKLRGNTSIELALGDLVNGAMVAGVVDQATSFALHREMNEKKQSGLHPKDITEAVKNTLLQNRDLNHEDELVEFISDFQEDVVDIKPAAV